MTMGPEAALLKCDIRNLRLVSADVIKSWLSYSKPRSCNRVTHGPTSLRLLVFENGTISWIHRLC